MKIDVALFAILKDRIGDSEITLDIADGSDADNLLTTLNGIYPDISEIIHVTRVAVNERFVGGDHVIHEGDSVALIPPSSGG